MAVKGLKRLLVLGQAPREHLKAIEAVNTPTIATRVERGQNAHRVLGGLYNAGNLRLE